MTDREGNPELTTYHANGPRILGHDDRDRPLVLFGAKSCRLALPTTPDGPTTRRKRSLSGNQLAAPRYGFTTTGDEAASLALGACSG